MARKKLPPSVYDLVIPEKIAMLARRGYDPEQIACAVTPVPLYMSAPPRPSCTVLLRETGEPIASCSARVAEESYGDRDLYEVVEDGIPRARQTLWAWNQAMLAQIREAYEVQERDNLILYKDETCLGGFDRAIMDAIGCKRWRNLQPGAAIDYAPGFGGRGIEFLTEEAGHLFLDAGVHGREVLIAQIAVERKGTRMGTRVMEAIRDYAVEHDLDLEVYKVTNRAYFAGLGWLGTRNAGSNWKATAEELREWREAWSAPRP